ncbi:MAG: globin [Dehalococcoidia bacterium]
MTSRGSLLDHIGGPNAVNAIVEDFYRRVEADPPLRAIYPEDLEPGKNKLKLFFEQWLGGRPVYSEKYGHPRLRRRHYPFVIDEAAAGRWLKHMREAMRANGVAPDDLAIIFDRLAPLARHMVNAGEDVPREPLGDTYLS